MVTALLRIEALMDINIQIKELSLKNKLIVMETIWDDICHTEEQISSPNWHKSLLKERLVEAEQGCNFIDWDTAKQNIRDDFSK
ncbi:MAG: acyl-protein synthetase [Gammaproteobacteria bacterium]|nr:MAG: acyl-protein synthetase [Gammaproteobacteria bacterium]